MATKRPLVARDKHGNELHVNDRVRHVEAFGSGPIRVVGIGKTPGRADGYEYLPVRLPGFGWVNPVTRCIKIKDM